MRRPSGATIYGCIALATLLIGPLARMHVSPAAPTIARATLPIIGGCVALHRWAVDWTPSFNDPDYRISQSYQCEGYRLHVSVVQYVEQHQGKEAVGEFNKVIPRSWWNSTVRRRESIDDDVPVNEYRVDRQDSQLTIWNWYAVGDEATASPFVVKALEAWHVLQLHGRATTNITVAIEGDEATDTTRALTADAEQVWSWFVGEGRAA
jgi:EpsI family protein